MERKTEHGTIKTYDMPSTEVLSMGLQFLHDDPLTFVLGDPEYYQFVMNLLRGVI